MEVERPSAVEEAIALLEGAVRGPWPSLNRVEETALALLECVPETADDATWGEAWDSVAAQLAEHFRQRSPEWGEVIRYVGVLFDRAYTSRSHQRALPGITLGEGQAARRLVPTGLSRRVALALMKEAPAEQRLHLIHTMADSEVFLAVLGSTGGTDQRPGLAAWHPTRGEVIALGRRVWETYKHDMMLGEFLAPFRFWASEVPDEAQAIVDAWLDRRDGAEELAESVVQILVEGAVAAKPKGWDGWRDGVVRRLVDSDDARRRELGPRVACFAWPDEERWGPEVRYGRMLELIEQGPPAAVLSGLGAMSREAGEGERVRLALRTARRLVENPKARALHGEDAVTVRRGVARVLMRGLHRLRSAEAAAVADDVDALLSALVEWEVEPGRNELDGCLVAVAEWDRARADGFLQRWLERHWRAVMARDQSLDRWFPVGFGKVVGGGRTSVGWAMGLMSLPSLHLRAVGGRTVSATRGPWTLSAAELASMSTWEPSRQEGFCYEVGAHVPRNSAWVGVLFQLGREVPSVLEVVTRLIREDGVVEWPFACQALLKSWQVAEGDITDAQRGALVEASVRVSEAIAPFLRLSDGAFRHPPEVESLTPAKVEWWQQEQRRMAEAMRAAEGESIWRQFMQEVPILRGDKVRMGEGPETEMRSFSATVELPMRARFDPLTSWMRRVHCSERAAELLGTEAQEA